MASKKRYYDVTIYGDSNKIKYECDLVAEKPSLAAKIALTLYGVHGVSLKRHVEGSNSKYIILVRLLGGARESETWYQV